jgi:hypothetical protein
MAKLRTEYGKDLEAI